MEREKFFLQLFPPSEPTGRPVNGTEAGHITSCAPSCLERRRPSERLRRHQQVEEEGHGVM